MYILACIHVNPKLQDLHIMFLYGTVLVGLELNDLSELFLLVKKSAGLVFPNDIIFQHF